MKRDKLLIGAVGVLGGYIGYRLASRALARARSNTPPFAKKTLHDENQLLAMFETFWRHPESLALLRGNPKISSPLTDQVAAAISQAYGVQGPSIARRIYALSVDLSQETIESQGAQNHAAALSFARHFAETGGRPDAEQVDRLLAAYDARTARDLVTYIRLMSIGVLVGNTLDAFVSRILGQPSPETTLWDEIKILTTFSLGILPLVPLIYMRTCINPAG